MTSSIFIEKLNAHYTQKLPFVVYSKPNLLTVKAILQKSDELHFTDQYRESGFVFAPFNSKDKTVLIPYKNAIIIENKKRIINHLNDVIFHENTDALQFKNKKKEYESLAQKTILKIKDKTYQKVVISREERLVFKNKNAIQLFLKLLDFYPNAFVYCFYHPKVGLWLGASPEILLSIKGDHFKTMSLAGTKKFSETNQWRKKEMEEQQLVTNYIYNNINDLIPDLTISEVENFKAGQLLHLKTMLSGTLKYKESNLKALVHKLHPTPAVCGLPKEAAKHYILEHEGYSREYYTGFLGELNFESLKVRNSNRRNIENNVYTSKMKTSELYVNLRCMQIKKDQAIVYVGGGITKDSVAESEWEETVNKSLTMKKVLC